MNPRRVTSFAPATIANLGPGFDILGLAIHAPGDQVTAVRRKEPGLSFSLVTDNHDVPPDLSRNVAAHVAQLMMDEIKPPFGVELTLHKKMPVGSGLGSSAASGVAAVVAVNALLSAPLKKTDLLRFAVEGERFTSGAPHADNVAPSLLGGVQLIRSYDPLEVLRVPVRNRMFWVVVHPHVVVQTRRARAILPESVPLRTTIRQSGHLAGLLVGLNRGNAGIVGRCATDEIIEPVRKNLIPGFSDVRDAALKAGATGCTISGSGPSLFAVAGSESSAAKIAMAMKKAFLSSAGVASESYVSHVNMVGARIVRVGRS